MNKEILKSMQDIIFKISNEKDLSDGELLDVILSSASVETLVNTIVSLAKS